MNAEELRTRTMAAVRRHPSRTHRAFRAHAILLMTSSVAVSLVIFFLAGGLRAAPRPESLVAGTLGGALAIAVLSVFAGLHRGRSMLPRPGWQLVLLVVLVPAALFAWKIAWSARYPGMMVDWPERPGLRCFVLTVAMGISPLASLVLLYRNSEPVRPGLVGAAMGVAVGAVTWVFLELWCPVAYPHHLLIGHVAPALLLAMIGAVLGRSMMTMGTGRRA
jgi:hypothetical protein